MVNTGGDSSRIRGCPQQYKFNNTRRIVGYNTRRSIGYSGGKQCHAGSRVVFTTLDGLVLGWGVGPAVGALVGAIVGTVWCGPVLP